SGKGLTIVLGRFKWNEATRHRSFLDDRVLGKESNELVILRRLKRDLNARRRLARLYCRRRVVKGRPDLVRTRVERKAWLLFVTDLVMKRAKEPQLVWDDPPAKADS